MKLIPLLLLLAMPAIGEDDNYDWYACQSGTYWREGGELTVVAAAPKEGKAGKLYVGKIQHTTLYEVDGFKHRWDFDVDPKTLNFRYAFTISPSGHGRYYDFSGGERMVRSSMTFFCKAY